MLWIPITVAAAGLQVARNALQRGLLADAGPWGATLVRFLFGAPFALVFLGLATLVDAPERFVFSQTFWIACIVGGAAQMGATAALLVSMRRSSFALGTVFSQSGIPLTAVFALGFGETLDPLKWLGLALTTCGLIALSLPRKLEGRGMAAGAALGVAAGAGFALSSNLYRQAGHVVAPGHPLAAAQMTLLAVQVIQAASLGAWLATRDRPALVAVAKAWRSSLGAGFLGAAASGLWFTAFNLSPVGPVRAVGVVEMPIAAFAGRRLFAERLTLPQIVAAAVTALGVGLAALG